MSPKNSVWAHIPPLPVLANSSPPTPSWLHSEAIFSLLAISTECLAYTSDLEAQRLYSKLYCHLKCYIHSLLQTAPSLLQLFTDFLQVEMNQHMYIISSTNFPLCLHIPPSIVLLGQSLLLDSGSHLAFLRTCSYNSVLLQFLPRLCRSHRQLNMASSFLCIKQKVTIPVLRFFLLWSHSSSPLFTVSIYSVSFFSCNRLYWRLNTTILRQQHLWKLSLISNMPKHSSSIWCNLLFPPSQNTILWASEKIHQFHLPHFSPSPYRHLTFYHC